MLLRERLVDVTDNLGTSLNLQSITTKNFLGSLEIRYEIQKFVSELESNFEKTKLSLQMGLRILK